MNGKWFAQDEVYPLLFTFFAQGLITLHSICDTHVNLKEIDEQSVIMEEEDLYDLICNVNSSQEALTPYEQREENNLDIEIENLNLSDESTMNRRSKRKRVPRDSF